MATISKVIEAVDGISPNDYDPEIKFRWMAELDAMVARDVTGQEAPAYEYPRDMDRQLLIPAPHDRVYDLYMEAMIDFRNRDYRGYNNAMMAFDHLFTEYKKAYLREHRPKASGGFKNL